MLLAVCVEGVGKGEVDGEPVGNGHADTERRLYVASLEVSHAAATLEVEVGADACVEDVVSCLGKDGTDYGASVRDGGCGEVHSDTCSDEGIGVELHTM